jgi:molybdate transport system permease protein
LIGLFLALPVVALLLRTLASGALGFAGTPIVLDALRLSLSTTAISLVITVCLGTPLAFVLARRRFRGVGLIETVIDLPIVLPPSVAGLALLLVFGRRGYLGEPVANAGLDIAFTTVAVVLAQVFVAAPFFIRAARAGIASVDADLEDAARVDGASERQIARFVSLPLAAPALAAGLVMSWARALGEFGATIMFAGSLQGVTQTLSLAIYEQFDVDFDVALGISALLVVVSAALLLAAKLVPWTRSASTSPIVSAPSASS